MTLHSALSSGDFPGPLTSFLLLSALLFGAAIPLAIAWARVIPPDEPDETPRPRGFAIVMLALVSLNYVAKLPLPVLEAVERGLLKPFPVAWVPWVILAGQGILIVMLAASAIYAVLRPGALSQPLLWASVLVAVVWLVSPFLLQAMLAALMI